MDDRALMQQALEALEEAQTYTSSSVWSPSMTNECAIVAAQLRIRLAQPESDPDPSRCPRCGGEADNGHDRCDPPNPYHCTKCMAQPEPVAADGWLRDGWLLYRLTDEARPKNRDEINVTMADGSRSDEARSRRAGELLDRIRSVPPPRQWVDLTDEEANNIFRKSFGLVDSRLVGDQIGFVRAISEALKAKNGGTE